MESTRPTAAEELANIEGSGIDSPERGMRLLARMIARRLIRLRLHVPDMAASQYSTEEDR